MSEHAVLPEGKRFNIHVKFVWPQSPGLEKVIEQSCKYLDATSGDRPHIIAMCTRGVPAHSTWGDCVKAAHHDLLPKLQVAKSPFIMLAWLLETNSAEKILLNDFLAIAHWSTAPAYIGWRFKPGSPEGQMLKRALVHFFAHLAN